MLNFQTSALVDKWHSYANAVASTHYHKYGQWFTIEELRSECLMALVECADRYPQYCTDHGYGTADMRYFKTYIRRRMDGAVKDLCRSRDFIPRSLREKLKKEGIDIDYAIISDRDYIKPIPLPIEEVAFLVESTETSPASAALYAGAAAVAVKTYQELPGRAQVALWAATHGIVGVLFLPPEGSKSNLASAAALEIRNAVCAHLDIPSTPRVFLMDIQPAQLTISFEEQLNGTNIDHCLVEYTQAMVDDPGTLIDIIKLSHWQGRRKVIRQRHS